MKLSIVTLTYNHLDEATRPYVESLFEHTASEDFELVVVDNGSTDGTVDYLHEVARDRPNVRIHANRENRGYSRGNNQGLGMIEKSDYVGLFNNDLMFTPCWLPRMIEAFERDPGIGLASPRINRDSRIDRSNYLHAYPSLLRRHREVFTSNITPYFCCVMMRRTTFERIGLLDERFSPAFFEDDDYSFRSLYAGYRNGYVNTAFVLHNHCTTSGGIPQRKALIERNRRLFYDKHWLGRYIYERELDRRRPMRRLVRALRRIAVPGVGP